MQQANNRYEYNSLKSTITSLSFYFRSNCIDNLTQDIQFITFHKGIRRNMKTDINPNRNIEFRKMLMRLMLSL